MSLASAQEAHQAGAEAGANELSKHIAGAALIAQPDVGIQNTERISIPFGITHTLPLRDGGQAVVVIGHGSCTAGETVTLFVTVTHGATGATAMGQTTESCSGEETLQVWSLTAAASGPALEAGQAEVCGLAMSYAGDVQTDSYAWCRPDVTLAWLHYLPLIVVEADNG